MNESCIGSREQRLLDKSKAAFGVAGVEPHSGTDVNQQALPHEAAGWGSSTGTLTSSVAEEHRIEQAAIELCDQVLQEIDEDSKFFASNPPRSIAMFHDEGTGNWSENAIIPCLLKPLLAKVISYSLSLLFLSRNPTR
jgi:hypothetical protein